MLVFGFFHGFGLTGGTILAVLWLNPAKSHGQASLKLTEVVELAECLLFDTAADTSQSCHEPREERGHYE